MRFEVPSGMLPVALPVALPGALPGALPVALPASGGLAGICLHTT